MNPKLVQNIERVDTMNVTNVTPPSEPAGVPRCPLPNSTRIYGRAHIIDDLVGRLLSGDATIAVCAVRGLPGVGKTDLLRSVGCDPRITAAFTGGVLYAELGPDPDALKVLTGWLHQLAVEIPHTDDPDVLAGLVRRTLADRRTLLIIDDVWESSIGTAQRLRSCANPGCRQLASSRSPEIAAMLADGPNHTIQLPVLDPDPALALLRSQASDAVAKDEAGAAELVEALGKLPLALKLAAPLLRNDRRNAHPCAALLATWQRRPAEMRGYERREGKSDEQLSLDTIIGMSYDALPDDATRSAAAALAAFGATPLDWDWDAMAAVWQMDEAATQRIETALINSGLLEHNDETRRYSLHQTVHAFLAQRMNDPSIGERHAAYYASLMERCDQDLKHESTIDAALAVLDREIAQIERGQHAATMLAPSASWNDIATAYALACTAYFELRGRYEQSVAWTSAGLQAAERQNRWEAAAALLSRQGTALGLRGMYDAATQQFQRSLMLHERIGDLSGIATTLGNLGNVYQLQSRYDEAIRCYEQSLAIKERIDDTAGVAATLANLGVLLQAQGRYEAALANYQRSLEIVQGSGDVRAVATTLGNIGLIYAKVGRYDEAVNHYRRSLAINERIGHQGGVAATLSNLGNVYQRQGRYEEAIRHYQRSLTIKEEIGDTHGVAITLGNLGTLFSIRGRHDEAIQHYQRSLSILQRIGDVAASVRQLGNLGDLFAEQRRYDAAVGCYQQSLAMAEQIGDQSGMATMLGSLGVVYRWQGRIEEASRCYHQSLEIAQRIGATDISARQLGNLGVASQALGRHEEAIGYYRQGLALWERIGDVRGAALTSWNLGVLYEAQGDLLAALPLIERRVEWEEQIGHPNAAAHRERVEQLRARIAAGEA